MAEHRNSLAKTSDERRAAIRSLLAAGMTMKAISEQMKCSTHTVAAVREMDAEPIGEEQKMIARKWTNVAQMAVEQVSERLAEGEQASLKELSIVGAVASDKLLALKGEPTARVVHERAESFAELREQLEAAVALHKEKAASVDVGADGGAEARAARVSTIKEARAADIESAALAEGRPDGAATGPADDSKTPAATGRGGSSEARPTPSQNDSPVEKISPNGPN